MVQHILVAHDLSAEADLALRRAAQLARQTGARLSLVHVLDEATNPASAQAYLRGCLRDYGLPEVEARIRQGRPVEEILAQTAGLEADLLVLGAHHRQSSQGFAGTTLERVLLRCPAAVLLAISPNLAPYQRAVAALDFSGSASRALRCAWRLLPATGVLHALNVHEVAEVHGADEDGLALQRELFGQLIEDLAAELAAPPGRLTHAVRQGERSNCLDASLAEQRPQLLALGGHSRGELSSALLGSLVRQMLERPPCDLLIAP
ncbi:universal stress protein [Stutzerimonas nosocomialis]|uniref:Universal stress protein n=1 Tax=Stutzerimonas nosocomialis TaxID=1056496 RepID=A0A5R9QE77_9GAMM|nr:universal stress protein [Stutzerimonas nosocomialis]TLX63198.1 universal stress protein [Stutzerimonas nosocomialis]